MTVFVIQIPIYIEFMLILHKMFENRTADDH